MDSEASIYLRVNLSQGVGFKMEKSRPVDQAIPGPDHLLVQTRGRAGGLDHSALIQTVTGGLVGPAPRSRRCPVVQSVRGHVAFVRFL